MDSDVVKTNALISCTVFSHMHKALKAGFIMSDDTPHMGAGQREVSLCTFVACIWQTNMSRFMRKPTFCICENKDADQLCGTRKADQRLCFRYIDSSIPLLSKSEISSLLPYFVAVQPGLCRTRSKTRMLVFS